MNIQLDLTEDWTNLTLKEIDVFKSIGFAFPSLSEWKKSKQNKIECIKNDANKSGAKLEEHIQKEYNQHLIYHFYNLQERLIENKPRKIRVPKGFIFKKNREIGLYNFILKVLLGDNLFPHLSRRIFDSSFSDGMLLDWGIQHFHLGTVPDKNNILLAQGTKEIVYAIVTDTVFYIILIDDHGKWADKALLKIIKDNYPELLSPYKLNRVLCDSEEISSDDRIKLRQAGINPITTIDGDAYFSMGGGINGANGSTNAVIKMNRAYRLLKYTESVIIENIHPLINEYNQSQKETIPSLRLELINVENNTLTLHDKYNHLTVKAHLDEQQSKVIRLSMQKEQNLKENKSQ